MLRFYKELIPYEEVFQFTSINKIRLKHEWNKSNDSKRKIKRA